MLLGAPHATTVGSNLYQGKAYVFVGNETTWTQQQELIDPDGALNDSFGSAVSISGNGATVSVGEPGFNAGQGAVYIFNAIAGSSTPTTTTLSTSANPSLVGQSVIFTADVIGYSPTGTVTFTDNGSNLATVPLVNWLATYTTAYSTAGTHAITAVYSGDNNNQPSTSAGLSQDVDMPWLRLQELTASDSALAALFGYSVAISGNTVQRAPISIPWARPVSL